MHKRACDAAIEIDVARIKPLASQGEPGGAAGEDAGSESVAFTSNKIFA